MSKAENGVRSASVTLDLKAWPYERTLQHGYIREPDWCVASTTQVELTCTANDLNVKTRYDAPLQVEVVMEWWSSLPTVQWGRVVHRTPQDWEKWNTNQIWGVYEAGTDHAKGLYGFLRDHFRQHHQGTDELLAVEAAYDALLLPRRDGDWATVKRYAETIQTIVMEAVEPRVVTRIRNELVEEFRRERWGNKWGRP